MVRTKILFHKPRHYDLSVTCHAHGWKNLAPFEWDDEKKTLNYAMLIADEPVDVNVSQRGNDVIVTIISFKGIKESSRALLKASVARTLDIDADTAPLLKIAEQVDNKLAKLVRTGAGRLLRSASLWEDAAKTLFTTNCSWALTQKMSERSCRQLASKPSPRGRYPFPSPQIICKYSEVELRKLLPIGYRASYLRSLAKAFCSGGQLNTTSISKLDWNKTYNVFRSLKGFGSYATNHMMILAGYFNQIPVDSEVTSYLKKVYRIRKIQSSINRMYGMWGEYKWWGFKLDKMQRNLNWLGDK